MIALADASPDHLAVPTTARRRGFAHWLRSYRLMLGWDSRSLRMVLPLAVVAQILLGAGFAVGLGFLIESITAGQAMYMATGTTVIAMITVGLVLAPQLIAQRKQEGSYDFVWSLPIPRTASVAASLTVNSLIALPGMIVALLVAAWRFDLSFTIDPMVVVAVALTLATASSVGFAMAHAIPNPMVTTLVTNVLVFVILLYSPIHFPAERLPGWLATLHEFLPFEHAANVMRATLTDGLAEGTGRSFAVLGLWAAGAWVLTGWVIGRRR